MLGNSRLVHPSAVGMHVVCIHKVMLLSVIVWVCMHGGRGGVLANLLLALLHSCSSPSLPSSPSFHLLPPPARRSGQKGLHLS